MVFRQEMRLKTYEYYKGYMKLGSRFASVSIKN